MWLLKITGLPFKYLFLFIIWFYRVAISPWIPSRCRFYPSCSAYSAEAIKKYGPVKGGVLAIKRILRCHPWNPGGSDPVP